MHPVNWIIVIGYLTYVMVDGIRRAKGTDRIEGYFLADRSLPWWAVGLSVMATQMSAVTLIGTTNFLTLMPSDSSNFYARNLLNLLQLIVKDEETPSLNLDLEDEIVAGALVTHEGAVRFQRK